MLMINYSKESKYYTIDFVLTSVAQSTKLLNTYEIFPKGANAALISSVVISGLRSPTKTWK